MKRNFRDAAEAAKTDFITAVHAYREASKDLLEVERDLRELDELPAPNPSDFLRVPTQVRDPQFEIREIKKDLAVMLNNLAPAEASIIELRAFLKRLIDGKV
jgi:hypothetical protein